MMNELLDEFISFAESEYECTVRLVETDAPDSFEKILGESIPHNLESTKGGNNMEFYAVVYFVDYESGDMLEGLRGIYSTREKAVENAKEGCQTYADLFGGTVEVDVPEYPFEFCLKPDIHRITEVVFRIEEVTVE